MTRRLFLLCLTLLLALSGCERGWRASVGADWPFPLDAEPVQATGGMVVATDRYASDVGAAILRSGGNAVDAAVATAFALAVVNSEAGNIGGGGFMVLRLADGTVAALDFREQAPLAATPDMYLDAEGNLTDESVLGHRAAGVPGTVAGLWEAHQRYGDLPWADLVGPAIRLAEGYVVRARQARAFAHAEDGLRIYGTTEATFLPNGRAPAVGDTFAQPALRETLERIRDHGPGGFYSGVTADLIVQEMDHGHGLITHEDLASYRAAWRGPISFRYRGYVVISMPPPSSGGATLAEIAHILEGYDLGAMEWHGAPMVHLLAEAWKRAYADRNAYLADPDFVEQPVARMISPEYGAERRGTIRLDRATPATGADRGLGIPAREHHTTHVSVVDADGNAVALTTTLNSFFGSKVTVAGGGFLLNDEMDDFTTRPGTPNQFGLVQGVNNAIEPGKRMLSAMTPTIVVDPEGRLFYVAGTPGGATIITDVFQSVMNVIDYGMNVVEAVNAPRLHHQHLPDRIQFEPGALSDEAIAQLRAMGHTVEERFDPGAVYPYIGDIQAIMRMPGGRLEGWSDPRRGGAAVGY